MQLQKNVTYSLCTGRERLISLKDNFVENWSFGTEIDFITYHFYENLNKFISFYKLLPDFVNTLNLSSNIGDCEISIDTVG